METHETVIDALERAPAIVVPLVREVPAALLKRRPLPAKWSAHEHACHLAVVHGLFFARLDHMLAAPAPIIKPYDPGSQDPDDRLLQMDLDDALMQFADERQHLVERLRNLTAQDWKRKFRIRFKARHGRSRR